MRCGVSVEAWGNCCRLEACVRVRAESQRESERENLNRIHHQVFRVAESRARKQTCLSRDRPAAQLLPLLEDDYATTWRLEALRELSTPAERVIRIFSNFMSSCNFLPVCVRTVAVLAITHLDVANPLVHAHELHLFLQLPLLPFLETAGCVSWGPQPRDAVLVLLRPAVRPVRGQVG